MEAPNTPNPALVRRISGHGKDLVPSLLWKRNARCPRGRDPSSNVLASRKHLAGLPPLFFPLATQMALLDSSDNERLVVDKGVAERIGLFNNAAEGENIGSSLGTDMDTGKSIL